MAANGSTRLALNIIYGAGLLPSEITSVVVPPPFTGAAACSRPMIGGVSRPVAVFTGSTPSGLAVFFATAEKLLIDDLDTAADVYGAYVP